MVYNKTGDIMARINISDVEKYLTQDNKLSDDGKEVIVYYYEDKVIKLFKKDRTSPFKRISDDGLIKLSELKLECFNTPVDIIYDNETLVGYTEKFLIETEKDTSKIDFAAIKRDLYALSENGFSIEDLFYNYYFTIDGLVFNDLTSYGYIKTSKDYLKQYFLKNNIIIMNNFLIGLLLFDAFDKNSQSEYTKIYLANSYRLANCRDMFYGDLIEKEDHKAK